DRAHAAIVPPHMNSASSGWANRTSALAKVCSAIREQPIDARTDRGERPLVRVRALGYPAPRGFRIACIRFEQFPHGASSAARPASTASRTTLVRAEEGGNAGGERNREVVQP